MPPREIRELIVPYRLYAKLATKGLGIEDVRQAVASASTLQRGPKNPRRSAPGHCYFIVGRTQSGRVLKVLVRLFTKGRARVITAWEPPKGR
jgi:hypothetical protein